MNLQTTLTEAEPGIRYEFVKPLYDTNRVCPLWHLAELSNEIIGAFKENEIPYVIAGSSAIGTEFDVTSDYMRRRTSCDIDLYIDGNNFQKVNEVFKNLGWNKYKRSESGLIRTYRVSDGEKELIDECQNIKGLRVYHKYFPEFDVNFLAYVSRKGDHSIKLPRRGGTALLELRGTNRTSEESFIHKMFREKRRDRSDTLALAETGGMTNILTEPNARETFFEYLNQDNVPTIKKYMQRIRKNRDKYESVYNEGMSILRKKARGKRYRKDFKVTIHYQTRKIDTDSHDFKKIVFGSKEKTFWLDESLKNLDNLLKEHEMNMLEENGYDPEGQY